MPSLFSTEQNSQLAGELKNLGNRQFLLLALITFLAVLALIIWGILPAFNNLTSTLAQIQDNQTDLEEIKLAQSQIQDIANNQEYLDNRDLVEQILYSTNPFLETLYSLIANGDQYQVNFQDYQYSPGLIATASAQSFQNNSRLSSNRIQNSPTEQGFNLFLEANGRSLDLFDFLQAIEKSAPLSTIGYVEISNQLLGYSNAEIEIITHYFQPNTVAASQNTTQIPTLNAQNYTLLEELSEFVLPNFNDLNQTQLQNSGNDIFGQSLESSLNNSSNDNENTSEDNEDATENDEDENALE